MKPMNQKILSLMLAVMVSFSIFSMANASEALIGQKTKDGYTILSVQYAYSETGTVNLYDISGQTIVATLASGTKLGVTDAQKDGWFFVQSGAVSGWMKAADLQESLPQNVTGQVSGSSAPNQAFTPVTTTPPETDASAEGNEMVSSDFSNENAEDNTAVSETVGDPEKDHPAIAAMYDSGDISSQAVAVDVVQLGVVTSIILLEEKRMEVDTALLSFGEEIPEEQKLGYVHAPRTGQAGLRETPAKDGKVITQLKAGQLVAVLALEENYAHVNVLGVEGWLRLDCLRYLQPAENGIVSSADLSTLGMGKQTGVTPTTGDKDETVEESETTGQDAADESASADSDAEVVITDNNGALVDATPVFPATAILSCKGETDGATSVNLRNLPTKDSAKAAVLRTGVEVTVLSELEGWYLVEADGVCGFVMEAFLAFDK